MNKLQIKRNTFLLLSSYCSHELIQVVFSDLGEDGIEIDDSNSIDNIWEITEFINVENTKLIDRLKVIFTFYYLGGTLIYKDDKVPYESLFRLLNKTECNTILLYWQHNIFNDIVPYFTIGEIVIPKIMPRYVCTKISDNSYIVEKWNKGEYVFTKYIYPTEQLCRDKVNELNREFDSK